MQQNRAATTDPQNDNRVSSPAASGGVGVFFEQHVAAYWLAQLLVGGIPPILIDSVVQEVSFQTEHLGLQTDDFLVVCEQSGSAVRKLVGQVKRNFTVSAANDECKKTIQDFWKDFKSSSQFSPTNDRLVLVVQRGTEVLLEHFCGLLDCARAARDGAEFEHRLGIGGFISEKAIRYCGELCKIIGDLEKHPVTASDVWPLLRILYVLSLDLASSTCQTEAYIKSLLAHMAKERDAIGIAEKSWNSLLVFASNAMYTARSLRRGDLPNELQQSSELVGANEQRVLHALKDHTSLILRGIHSTLGLDFHLERAALVQRVLNELESTQVVLVSGPAGCGKSSIGKDVISFLSQDYFTFGFRVEEFAKPHFDETLNAGQIPANAKMLSAILSAQSRKVVLVESVERLLEKTTRDAFSDLLTLATSDPTMHIILTCRDYSIDLVRSSFLQPAGIKYASISVHPLSDGELAEAQAALPQLTYPLMNPALREILRNPYFLDKALQISWSAERPVPESEREFRLLFWRQIVRADHPVAIGMARHREDVFQKIAVRRARALSAYIVCDDLDPAVIDTLRQDSLISSPEGQPLLIATAHDVLEDWAILQWLEEQNLIGEGSFVELSVTIGTHPAIRRSYRKWVAELVECDPTAADKLFTMAISETGITAQFRDDTLVSLLKAPSSPILLMRHEAQLMENDKALLKRVIYLIRVACVKTPDWLTGVTSHGSILYVPDGQIWATVLKLVHCRIDSFTPQERPLLLGLIEDAVRNVSWKEPDLDGAESVAGIGYWLLAGMGDYSSNEQRNRVLQVIAKIPRGNPTLFEGLLRGTFTEGKKRDYIAEDFREIIYTGMSGMPAARDLPDLIISVAYDYLFAREEDLRDKWHSRSSYEVETCFGIKEHLSHAYFPPSAIRGPWIPLLRYHSRKALDLLICVFNYSIEWYIHPRVENSLEPAWEIEITFADGGTQKHWGNPRLWNLYRGTSVGPYVLQSMLMALEKWLLDFASQYPQRLDDILVEILRRSESATLASVVASIATAHPHSSGEALLVLLSATDYIAFDRGRMLSEAHASTLSGIFPQLDAENKIYESERNKTDQLPHRSHDLETAIANLQLGPLASRVHAILDRHLAALPPKSEQTEPDLIWRLAIHRMDLRQYTISDTSEPETSEKEGNTKETSKRLLRLEPKNLEPDVQAMVDKSADLYSAMNQKLGVLMWGIHVFKHEKGNYDPMKWKDMLARAKAIDRKKNQLDGSRNGPGFIAAVCVRDHWDEMSANERNWCVDVVVAEIERLSNNWSQSERMQRFSMASDRPCALVVSLLLDKKFTERRMLRVQQAFVAALTHPNEEVRWYMTWGIDRAFLSKDHELAMRCVNAIAEEASLIDVAWLAEEDHPYHQRRSSEEIRAGAAIAVRQAFWLKGAISESAYSLMDISLGFAAEINPRILSILMQVPEEPATIAAFSRASRVLVDWWNTDYERRAERNFHIEALIGERLQQFVMQTSSEAALEVLQPILGAIDRHYREIQSIIQGLTNIEDSSPNTPRYWYLWSLFVEGIKKAKWVSHLNSERSTGGEILSAIFLTAWWKENVKHWRSLEGYAFHVDALFEVLPPSSIVLDNYVRFLYHIGERSLPAAFINIADSLKRGNAPGMLQLGNTVFLIEILLQRHVYGRPLELKSDRKIREAVLFILDTLVENGSSAAFRMRDDFVTPS